MKSRGAIVDAGMKSFLNVLSFTNIKLGGRKTSSVSFKFHNDKVYDIMVFLFSDKEPLVLDLYNEVREDLISVYGDPGKKVREFKSPYEENDGHEITVLKGGYAKIKDYWFDEVNQTAIKLSIDEILIILMYQNMDLFEEKLKSDNPLKDY